MKFPNLKVNPVKSEVLIMAGGLKEDVSQLELKGGELIKGLNYQVKDGQNFGYASIEPYERFNGMPLASEVGIKALIDHGNDSRCHFLVETTDTDSAVDLSRFNNQIGEDGMVVKDPKITTFNKYSMFFDIHSRLVIDFTGTRKTFNKEWTIEFQIKTGSLIPDQTLITDGKYFEVSLDNRGHLIANFDNSGSGTWEPGLMLVSSERLLPAQGTNFTHVALVKYYDQGVRFFIDGRKDNAAVDISGLVIQAPDQLIIGEGFQGWLDEIRISNVPRYYSTFQPPITRFSRSDYDFYQIDDKAREAKQRTIGTVPGKGSVLGVKLMKTGDVLAVRDDTLGFHGNLFKSSPGGWSNAIGGQENLMFEIGSGGATEEFKVGDMLTGGTSQAQGEIDSIIVTSGDFKTGDAKGVIHFVGVTKPFTSGEGLDNNTGVTAKITAGSISTFKLEPNGAYEFTNCRFDRLHDLQRQNVTFFANGVNPCVYFDGMTIMKPVIHPNLPDRLGKFPVFCVEFKNRLWLAYADGQLWFSAVGDPTNFDTATGGAGSFYVEDTITALEVAPGDSLIVYGRNTTDVIKSLYDSQKATKSTVANYSFTKESFSTVSGAIRGTVNRMLGDMIYLDDRGVSKMSATNNFGDFSASSISKNVQKIVMRHKDKIVGALVHRENNQYRLFFNDRSGLIFTFDIEKKVKGVTPFKYNHTPSCLSEGESASGEFQIYFGSDDGFVYKVDSGTSFDGSEIETALSTAFYSYHNPTVWKDFKKLTLEMQADINFRMHGKVEFNYRDGNLPNTSVQELTSEGYGSVYGEGIYGEFKYGAREVQNPVLRIFGYGVNMSIKLSSRDKYSRQHVINSAIVEYADGNRMM